MYVGKFEEYDVDGRALVLLDDEDFDNMEIWNKIHRKKIWVEIKRIFTLGNIGNMARAHEIRREKIRKSKLFNASAVFLQRCYRGRYTDFFLFPCNMLFIIIIRMYNTLVS